ncbi:ferritin-like protein [Ruegeria sp. Ofav3-42]|uniref:ferritin-like domain-containing protein n=1 Tax=Ruegeria sp. Ofav3-42 TaxID=2917759 RepID=UPI001EF4573B|nr:ferritin-like protein [Ruegeria sp. Ofav3-42]MCG7521556.1 ferritin-like protein [Ruegeria sp. Ofav3-42]
MTSKEEKLRKTRKKLCELLQDALMLELTTIPPYATACYSILEQGQYDRSEPTIVNAEPIEVIRQVMVEEMLHMVLVANVLNAIGGKPELNNPDLLPTYPGTLLKGRGPTVHLRRFCPEQIKSFRLIETAPKDTGPAKKGDYRTIGGFYTFIMLKLEEACDVFGDDKIFTGDAKRQISNDDYFGAGGEVIEVIGTSTQRRDAAMAAIRKIMEEGEGADMGDRAGDKDIIPGPEGREDVAHYFKFNEILHSRYYHPDDSVNEPPTGGDLIVDWSAVSPMQDDPCESNYEKAPELAALSAEFNEAWTGLLDGLHIAFNKDKSALRALVPNMYNIKFLAQKLMRIPLPDGSGETAGPTWTYLVKK